jgi:hypothetical protein
MKNTVFWDISGVTLVKTDISEESFASINRVTRIVVLETMLAVANNKGMILRNVGSYKRNTAL